MYAPGSTTMCYLYRGLLNLPTLPLTLKAIAPQVESAILKSNGEKLVLHFDMNVNSETECSKIIDWSWKDTNSKYSKSLGVNSVMFFIKGTRFILQEIFYVKKVIL